MRMVGAEPDPYATERDSPYAIAFQPDADCGRVDAADRVPVHTDSTVRLNIGHASVAMSLQAPVVTICAETAETDGVYEAMQIALERILGFEGFVCLHAACMTLGDQDWLFLGDSGTGKSTLAAACARDGGVVLTDDSVFVRLSPVDQQLEAFSGRSYVALREGALPLLDRSCDIAGMSRLLGPDGPKWAAGVVAMGGKTMDKALPRRVGILEPPGSSGRGGLVRARVLAGKDVFSYVIQRISTGYLDARLPGEAQRILPVVSALASLPAYSVSFSQQLLVDPGPVLDALVMQSRNGDQPL